MAAAIAAAEGGNGAGVCGAAPGARMAWLRAGPPFMLEEMIRHDPGPERPVKVKNWSIGTGEPFSRSPAQAVARRAFRETAERGIIHVLAAGNDGRGAGGDCGKSPLCASPHVIVVAACDRARRGVPWSGYGGAVTACAPSAQPGGGSGGILTASDGETSTLPFAKDYTSSFGGTSAAAPQVAGLIALGAEVLPALDVRLAKHLLARTCVRPADETPGQWRNSAGVNHSPKTGFGVIDAGRFVEAACRNPLVTPLRLEPDFARRDDELGMERITVKKDIPDGEAPGISREFSVKGGTPLEEVEIFLEVRHRRRGELSATLESPSGTKHALFTSHLADKGEDVIWIFTTHAFWGEEPRGVWRLTVTDSVTGETGRWESFAWRMRMGELRE